MDASSETVERVQGRSGELALRRRGTHLEVIVNGAFLISDANDRSSRAMMAYALSHLRGDALDVLIGGLGLGFAVDEALACSRVAAVTAVEYEPAIVRWFRRWGGVRAARAAAAERAGRARIEVGDVADLLACRPAAFDSVALDTDNGPDWLVREENAALYGDAGVRCVRAALRPGGVAAYWATARAPAFEKTLAAAFPSVLAEAAHDVVDGHRHAYLMYLGMLDGQPCESRLAPSHAGGPVGFGWEEPVEIAWALEEAHPDADPLDLNFVDLNRMVVELPGFDGDPEGASEGRLEAIVVAWHEQR